MKIAVAGTGYVGLVTGVCLASKGHQVTCVDVDESKVEIMKKGISPIYEPGLSELMTDNMERLDFTTDYAKAYKDAEVIFIGVGTPEKKDGSANLSYVYTVVEQIAASVEHECVVVVKSTVPIGTNDKIETYIIEHLKHDVPVHIASNPEFLAQGTAVRDTLHASRIVIGAESDYAKKVLEKVYENFEAPKVITNRRSAEMIKYASNDFLALKISYVNEIANLCEIVGADIEDVTKGMGLDARIGDKFLNSGIGYGGSCFPKDTKALSWLASFNDNEIKGRINLAGGEPLMSRNIDRLIDYIASKGIEVSIITNGYYLDDSFIERHKNQVSTIGISVDSLDYDTNVLIGRCFKANTLSKEQLIHICNSIKKQVLD